MKKFKKIYIEITNVCNLACSFCPETKRKPEVMSLQVFDKILEEIMPYGEYIYLHVKGEPLSHPELDKFLDLCYEKNLKANITTNGTLISKMKDKILMKPALRQINFSLHSFDGNENNRDKEGYVKDIIDFVKEATKKTQILTSFRLWNLDRDNLTNLKKQKNREILEIIEKEFNLGYKIEEKLEPGRGIKIAERVYLNQDHEFQWPDLKLKESNTKGFCYGLRNQIAILVDGTVVPCCLDGEGIINLGNIREDKLSEILETSRSKSIIEGFSKREAVEELCRKCGYREKFQL